MVSHAGTSQVDLETKKKMETAHGKSAQREGAPVLVLHTIGPANRAYLEQHGTEGVHLHFRGLRYGVDDYAPSSLFGLSISPSVTAGEFVCRQMLRRFGYREDEWSVLARQFLMKHTSCQPDRSQPKR